MIILIEHLLLVKTLPESELFGTIVTSTCGHKYYSVIILAVNQPCYERLIEFLTTEKVIVRTFRSLFVNYDVDAGPSVTTKVF